MKKYKFLLITVSLALLVISFFSCEDYTEEFPVPNASLVAQFDYYPEDPIRPGTEVTFKNTSVIPKKMGEVTFTWKFGDGTETVVNGYENVVIETEEIVQIEDSLTHTFTESGGDYTVELVVTTASKDTAIADMGLATMLIGDTLFFENFNDIQTIPSNWVLENKDGLNPAATFSANFTDSAWVVAPSSLFGSNVATAISYYDPEGTADDWMILPAVTVGDSAVLSWKALSFTSSADYPDDYQIFATTYGQDSYSCLNDPNLGLLRTIEDESWEEGLVSTDGGTNPAGIVGEGIQSRKIYLADYGIRNMQIYIAFRLMTPDPGGSSLGIDDIAIIDLK